MAVMNVIPETLVSFTAQEVIPAAAVWGQENGIWIKDLIDRHKKYIEETGIEIYQAAYDGFFETVELREKSRGDGINNKLMPNYAQIVVDTPVDYLLGKPVIWAFEDKEGAADKETLEQYRKDLLALLEKEAGRQVMREQLTQGGIGGYSVILAWVDEKGNIDFDEFPIQETIPVYDLRGRLQLLIRYYPIESVETTEAGARTLIKTRVEVYDDRYRTDYISNAAGTEYYLDEDPNQQNPIEHKAGRIPVSIFVNGSPARYEARIKKNGTSDLGNGVFSLLENLAHVISDKANTVDRLLDQFLKLKGVDVDEGDVVRMVKARAIALKSKDSDAEFIAPQQEDTAVEHHIDRLLEMIHDTTGTPRMNEIAGATATEIKMKYAGLDIKAGKKELYFTSAVKQLVAILTDLLNAKRLVDSGAAMETVYEILAAPDEYKGNVKLYRPEWVTFTLNRNLPQNFAEIATIFGQLYGKVPDFYLYELLWFIEDPAAALKDMDKQKKEAVKAAQKAVFGEEFTRIDTTPTPGGNPETEGGAGGG